MYPSLLLPSIEQQIPQGWQIRHPRWCRRPGLLGRGFGILSGGSSRTRRERLQRQQKVQNRTETHPIGHQKRRGIVQVVGYGHDRVRWGLAEHPLGLVAEERQEIRIRVPRILSTQVLFLCARANDTTNKNTGEYLHQPYFPHACYKMHTLQTISTIICSQSPTGTPFGLKIPLSCVFSRWPCLKIPTRRMLS